MSDYECPGCEQDVEKDWVACPYCGLSYQNSEGNPPDQSLATTKPQSTSHQGAARKGAVAVLAVVLVAACATIGIVVNQIRKTPTTSAQSVSGEIHTQQLQDCETSLEQGNQLIDTWAGYPKGTEVDIQDGTHTIIAVGRTTGGYETVASTTSTTTGTRGLFDDPGGNYHACTVNFTVPSLPKESVYLVQLGKVTWSVPLSDLQTNNNAFNLTIQGMNPAAA